MTDHWAQLDSINRDSDAWADYMDALEHVPRTHAGRCNEAEAIDQRSAQPTALKAA